ncbi:DUF930 domain-containing protein [Bosea sp. NPDC055353]
MRSMRIGPAQLWLAGFLASLTIVGQAQAATYEKRLRQQFERVELQTRLEEVCDTEVMLQINRDHPEFTVDKVIAYTFQSPTQKSNRLIADGAAFRSRNRWFRLAYRCQTGPRHLDITELNYKVGSEIERKLWHRLYLYD